MLFAIIDKARLYLPYIYIYNVQKYPPRDIYPFSGMLSDFQTCVQDKRYTKSTQQIWMLALLISKTYQRIAVALCLHVSACNLNKPAQIPLQFYWSPVIVSVFGTELDSWGCCLHVTLWVGITIGSKLQAMVAEFYLYSMHYQAQHLAHKSVCKAHNPGLRFRGKHDKKASEVNKGGCSC